MASIKLTNKQLRLIQKSLDLYSRIGILQLDEILSVPTIDNFLYKQFTPNKELQVGDNTTRGKIVEIGEDFIKTEGTWSNGIEIKTWNDIDKIRLSPDYGMLHETSDKIKTKLNEIKVLITGDNQFYNAYTGIYGSTTDNSCREAFDMIQYIRHEFWKADPNHSNITVDSSITKSSIDMPIIVKLDNNQDNRKEKLHNLK